MVKAVQPAGRRRLVLRWIWAASCSGCPTQLPARGSSILSFSTGATAGGCAAPLRRWRTRTRPPCARWPSAAAAGCGPSQPRRRRCPVRGQHPSAGSRALAAQHSTLQPCLSGGGKVTPPAFCSDFSLCQLSSHERPRAVCPSRRVSQKKKRTTRWGPFLGALRLLARRDPAASHRRAAAQERQAGPQGRYAIPPGWLWNRSSLGALPASFTRGPQRWWGRLKQRSSSSRAFPLHSVLLF